MPQKHQIAILGAVAIGLFLCPTRLLMAEDSEVLLQVTGLDGTVSVQKAPDLKLDFRYAPKRWQTCLGLPHDPHKSIVGSGGGLYYDYGGGRFHDFKIRVQSGLETIGEEGASS